MNKKLGNRIKSSGHEQTRERVEKDIIFVKNNSKFEILFLETVLAVAVISKSQFNTTKKCTPPPPLNYFVATLALIVKDK